MLPTPETKCCTGLLCAGHMTRDVNVIGHLNPFLSVNQFGILVHILCIGLQCWGRLEHTVCVCVCVRVMRGCKKGTEVHIQKPLCQDSHMAGSQNADASVWIALLLTLLQPHILQQETHSHTTLTPRLLPQ